MTQEPEKKIIIDEDWKTQVERKHTAEAQGEKGPAIDADAKASNKPPQEIPLPPASLIYLATSLYYQALTSLGLMPDAASGKVEKDLRIAKHTIDLLEMLEEKTAGNRTADESADLEAMLHQLRMAYVQSIG